MRRLDYTLFASTQTNPGGPIVQYVDDEPPHIELSVDSDGKPTRAGLIGYMIAYVTAFAVGAWFLLV